MPFDIANDLRWFELGKNRIPCHVDRSMVTQLLIKRNLYNCIFRSLLLAIFKALHSIEICLQELL